MPVASPYCIIYQNVPKQSVCYPSLQEVPRPATDPCGPTTKHIASAFKTCDAPATTQQRLKKPRWRLRNSG